MSTPRPNARGGQTTYETHFARAAYGWRGQEGAKGRRDKGELRYKSDRSDPQAKLTLEPKKNNERRHTKHVRQTCLAYEWGGTPMDHTNVESC